MQGYLDHLEPGARTLSSLRSRTVWTPRFARLNATTQSLELFVDRTLQQRILRLELANADVISADELGELLAGKPTAHVPEAHTRRFVFRVACGHDVHYFCANESDHDVDVATSRAARDQWIRALRTAAAILAPPTAPLETREVHSQLATYLDALFVSAHVTARHVDETGHGLYQFTVHAWTLQRELAPVDHGATPQWQVLEYASTWRVAKTSAQLSDLDAQLRLLGLDLRDIALPSFRGVRAFLHRHDDDNENARRVALVDAYVQQLLRVPDLSVFGSDGGTRLDGFLEISSHVAGLKKVETTSGRSLNLRKKRVVPWRERETFELLLERHHATARASEKSRAKLRSSSSNVRTGSSGHARSHDPHSRRATQDVSLPELPEAVPEKTAVIIEAEPVDSVHERIARIGHKLLVEAFTTPSPRHGAT